MRGVSCGPYFDPDFDPAFERVNPRVCVDNETCNDCTLIKRLTREHFDGLVEVSGVGYLPISLRRLHEMMDSANRHGILLELVELLTDLDLVISKAYISSDGGWLMDVFHVTDHLGDKLTDPSLVRYIEQSLDSSYRGSRGGRVPANQRATEEVRTCLGKLLGPSHLASEYAAVEIMASDRPGLVSNVASVIAELDCDIVSAQGWTHNSHAAIILYLTEHSSGAPVTDRGRLAHIEQELNRVLEAHYDSSQRRRVAVSGPTPGRIHTERRLHQLMIEDEDYQAGLAWHKRETCAAAKNESGMRRMSEPPHSSSSAAAALPSTKIKTLASIDSWKERGYSVVNITSRDRPKLLFDTVCTLTDMQYAVFHATVRSQGPLAFQEYCIRHKDGCTLDSLSERQKVIRCLVAAVERRVSHGLRIDIYAKNRPGLLSNFTGSLRENGLTLSRMEIAIRGEKAVGTFYVKDASMGMVELDRRRVEKVRKELGEGITLKVVDSNLEWCSARMTKTTGTAAAAAPPPTGRNSLEEDKPRFSLGSLLWSHIERLSSNFGSIRS